MTRQTLKIYVPMDSAAKALGADDIARALQDRAAARGIDIRLVRTGSRGMIWLEPLVEISRDGGPRIAHGPVTADQIDALLDGTAPSLGPTEDIPFLARQTRLTFARCGVQLHSDAHGSRGHQLRGLSCGCAAPWLCRGRSDLRYRR